MIGISRATALAAVASVLLAGSAFAQDKIKLRVSTPAPPPDFLTKSIEVFKQGLEVAAPGQFDVSGHPGGSLFKQGTEIPAMQRGNLEMNTLATFEVGDFAPETSIYNAGYLFRDYAHMKKVWNSDIGDAFRKTVRDKVGITLLADCYLGTRHLGLREVKNVKTPADLKGVKLRMPGSKDFLLLGRALGLEPTPMAMSEVYVAMKAGTIDGQDNPLSIARAAKFGEVSKEFVLTGHSVQNVFYAIANPVFDKMTPEQKTAVLASAKAACAWNDQMRLDDEARTMEAFKAAGITITTPDKAAFEKNVWEVYEKEGRSADWDKALIAKIRGM